MVMLVTDWSFGRSFLMSTSCKYPSWQNGLQPLDYPSPQLNNKKPLHVMNYDSISPPGIHQHVGFFSVLHNVCITKKVSANIARRGPPQIPIKMFYFRRGNLMEFLERTGFSSCAYRLFSVFLCIRELDKVMMWYCMVRWRQPCCLLQFANQTCPAFSSKKSQKTCLTEVSSRDFGLNPSFILSYPDWS